MVKEKGEKENIYIFLAFIIYIINASLCVSLLTGGSASLVSSTLTPALILLFLSEKVEEEAYQPPIFVSPFPLSHIYIWRLGRGEGWYAGGEEKVERS